MLGLAAFLALLGTLTGTNPQAAVDDLTNLGMRLDAIEQRITAVEAKQEQAAVLKIPHMIAVETGVDLGPWAGWDRYYEPQVGQYVALASQVQIVYTTTNCAGATFATVSTFGAPIQYGVGVNGHIYKFGARQPPTVRYLSVMGFGAVTCGPLDFTNAAQIATDTGLTGPVLFPRDVTIELR